jgi:hypothetical protein
MAPSEHTVRKTGSPAFQKRLRFVDRVHICIIQGYFKSDTPLNVLATLKNLWRTLFLRGHTALRSLEFNSINTLCPLFKTNFVTDLLALFISWRYLFLGVKPVDLTPWADTGGTGSAHAPPPLVLKRWTPNVLFTLA